MIDSYMDIAKRHDFTFLVDVENGNPNGDPDAGNLPRIDPETMHGLISDGAIKRKIRNWVDIKKGTEEHFKIYIQDKGIALNELHQRAYTAKKIVSTGSKQKPDEIEEVQRWMRENFFDIRTFGAVMNMSVNCGQVHGPLQIMFARSVDPILPLDMAITRVAVTKIGEDKTTEMGRKAFVPYGLYRGYGFFVPHYAKRSECTEEDLTLVWDALQNMWEIDRSAARGMMSLKGLYIFSHENPLGNAPAHRLFERVAAKLKQGVTVPRHITDYAITVNDVDLPDGITLKRIEP